MILDSTFLVDLERETRRGTAGKATEFLNRHPNEPLRVTFTIAGELAAGDSLGRDHRLWLEFLRPFEILGSSKEVAWRFGTVYRELKKTGMLIGANDLWIAATALAHAESLVTRNDEQFRRVTDLTVISY
jgi:tRNA(fMet)-specific endonuclease VapC